MITCYPKQTVYYTHVTSQQEYDNLINHYIGNELGWVVYYSKKYKNVWVVDADEILIERDTLENCVVVAKNATRDMIISRYVDGIEYGDDDMINHSFKDWGTPILNPFLQLLDQPKKWGTLHID